MGFYKWSAEKALHKKVVLEIAIRAVQGRFIAAEIFPERAVPDREYYYLKYGKVGLMAPARAEIAEAEVAPALPYTEVKSSCQEYAYKAFISEHMMKWATRNVVADIVSALSETIHLRQEYQFFNAILTETEVNKVTIPAGSEWDAATPGDALDHIEQAKELIHKTGHVTADTLILNPHDVRSILKQSAVRDLLTGTGEVAGLARILPQLNIYVTDAVDEAGNLLLRDKAIVMKRGPETGQIAAAEPLSTRNWESEDPRGRWVMLWKTFNIDIFRPKNICVIENTEA